MILNHKDAIEFLVASAEDIGFNRHTILNLHGLLANNLLVESELLGLHEGNFARYHIRPSEFESWRQVWN